MGGTASRRAVQVLIGEFMGTDYPEGDVDVIATFRGSPDTNPPQVGRIGVAYDYYWDNGSIFFDTEFVDDSVPDAVGLIAGNVDDTDDTPEIIGTSWSGSPTYGYIAWWDWDDSNGWSEANIIAGSLDRPAYVATADIDMDGDIDVVATIYGTDAIYQGGSLMWYENLYGDGSVWSGHEIYEFVHPYAVAVGQLDLDDPVDIIVTTTDLDVLDNEGVYVFYGADEAPWFHSQPHLVWENENAPTSGIYSPRSVRIADIDGDQDDDVVVSFTGDDITHEGEAIVVAYAIEVENERDWTFESVNPGFHTCRDTYPVDFDGDGDMDLAASSLRGNYIYGFLNTGNPADRWTPFPVSECPLPKGLGIYDFGGEEEDVPEIVVASYGLENLASYVYLYEWVPPPPPEEDEFCSSYLSVICSSEPALNGSLTYTYEYDLENVSTKELYAWYTIVTPGLGKIVQTEVDTLGTAADVYYGGGSVSLPDSQFSVGDKCQFFVCIGYTVTNEQDTPVAMPHAHDADYMWFEVVSPNDLSGEDEVDIISSSLPLQYSLEEIRPNPFNSMLSITVTLPEASEVAVTVYNIMGQQVVSLADGNVSAGRHTLTLDGSNLASGLYFVNVSMPGHLDTVKKVTLLK